MKNVDSFLSTIKKIVDTSNNIQESFNLILQSANDAGQSTIFDFIIQAIL